MTHIMTQVSMENEWEGLLDLSSEFTLKLPPAVGEGPLGINLDTTLGVFLPKGDMISLGLSLERTEIFDEGYRERDYSIFTQATWSHRIAKGWKLRLGPIFSYDRSMSVSLSEEDRSDDQSLAGGLSMALQSATTRFQTDLKYIRQFDPEDPHAIEARLRARQGLDADLLPFAEDFFKAMHIAEFGLGGEYRYARYLVPGEDRHRLRLECDVQWELPDSWRLSTGIISEIDITKDRRSVTPFVQLSHRTEGWNLSFGFFYGEYAGASNR
jgi:hypothetical protein